jgi:protein-S-isoprenylcysteine O-methyltransferase Ste14
MLRVYQVVFAVMGLISLVAINPELAQERSEPCAEGIDPAVRPVASVLFLATVAVAALDIGRLHWACPLSKWAQIAAFIVLIAANVLQIWAMAANPFFSTALRLQTERGHHLITHGPYRFVRHPGYMAMLLIVLLTALALGSTLALIPASIYGAIILFRSACEDRFLMNNLAGYANYAEKVRYRLIPGVW